ncbi:MAG: type IV secretion system DNA-binding domain-containing protein [Thiobacillus sp.]
MSTKHRIHEGFFRAKLLGGAVVLGAFLGVITYIFYLADWADMGLIEIWRIGAYVYERAPGMLGLAAFGGGFTVGWPVWIFAWRPGSARPGDGKDDAVNLRGQSLATVSEIKKRIRRDGAKTRLEIGGVPIPVKAEDRNFLFAGTVGVGKSQAITRMLDTLRADGHRAVVADASGIFYSRYAGRDAVLLNPYDRRSVSWSPLADIDSPEDCAAMARSIVPDGHGNDASWHQYAQVILDAVMRHVWSANGTTGEFVRLASWASTDELREVLPPGPVMALLDPGSERMFSNARSIIGAHLQPFSSLDPRAGRDAFSIRRHISDSQGWLFVTYKQSQLAAMKPLIASAIDVASRAVLDLPPAVGDRSAQRRTWFVLDEMPLLGRITSLLTLLTNGSKHGSAVLCGLQAISSLRGTYGHDDAQTILATLGTWLTLRVPDPETAEYMSRSINDAEIRRTVKSTGKSDGGPSENSQEQYSSRRVVLPSQLQNLGDLHGYLNISGELPVCAVTLPIAEQRKPAAEAFEPAPLRSAVPVPVAVLVQDDDDTPADDDTITDTPFTLER